MDSGNSETVPDLPKPPRRNGKRNSVTTDDHAKEFAQYIEEWQSKLNLGDWRIEPSGKPADKGGNGAGCHLARRQAGCVVLRLQFRRC